MTSLVGRVCVVTGATRGIGKGIALQLAEHGAKVYVTGRTLDPPQGSNVVSSLRDTAREIEARGGTCVPIQCDHANDEHIERLFETVKQENGGQLDILVNNAYSAVSTIFSSLGTHFYEHSPSLWDTVNHVGLRNHYICAVHAARMMVPRKRGLIVNVSSSGGLCYIFNAPYGVGKEACDRMAADCGFELREHNVTFISLWPGAVATETLVEMLKPSSDSPTSLSQDDSVDSEENIKRQTWELVEKGETTEFSGQCIVAIARDPDVIKMAGKIVTTYDIGRRYGLKDKPGHLPMDICSVKLGLQRSGHKSIAAMVPAFVRVPKWLLLAYAGNKFF